MSMLLSSCCVSGAFSWDKLILSSVSDADREIPARRHTDDAGYEVNQVFGIIRWPESWDFSVCTGDR